MTLRLSLALLATAALVGAPGCKTVGTAVGTAGNVAGDTATAAGKAASTAAKGAGSIVEKTADTADDEIRGK